jgi:hypothetical protein
MHANFWSENLKGRYHSKDMRRWADNIKTDLRKIVWEAEDWFNLAHKSDKYQGLLNTIMNLRVP